MGEIKKPPTTAYMKMPPHSDVILIDIPGESQPCLVRVIRKPTGAVSVEVAKEGNLFELRKVIRPFKTILIDEVKYQLRRKRWKKLKDQPKRIIRLGRTPLSDDKQDVINYGITPDASCAHVNVKWQNDIETNTRCLLCADCAKILKIENVACNHTTVGIVKQHYSPHTQMRCVCCNYTWWDTKLPNKDYVDPNKTYDFGPYEDDGLGDPDGGDNRDKDYPF